MPSKIEVNAAALAEAKRNPITFAQRILGQDPWRVQQEILRSVATNRGMQVEGTVRAEGDLDFRGTMGVDREAAVGFTAIRLSFDLATGAPAEDVAALIETTERYCVVLQTLTRSPHVTVSTTPA